MKRIFQVTNVEKKRERESRDACAAQADDSDGDEEVPGGDEWDRRVGIDEWIGEWDRRVGIDELG